MKKELIELITTFPDRKELNNKLFKYQLILIAIGGGIGTLINLLLSLFLPTWFGLMVATLILIYVGIMTQKARTKVMRGYDEGKEEINKILKQK